MSLIVSRRRLLSDGVLLFTSALMPRVASAAGARDPRLIVIVLHGALDGLATVTPNGDPEYAALNRQLSMPNEEYPPLLPLDGFFALNSAMPQFARMFRDGKSLVVHATATNYRERSHFDGQDVLESGMPGPKQTASGWLNRALNHLSSGDPIRTSNVLAIGPATPTILRGPTPVLGWAPPVLPNASDDLARRVLDLYWEREPALFKALQQALRLESTTAPANERSSEKNASTLEIAAAGAAKLLSSDDGPRVAAMVVDGWDTHSRESVRLSRLLNKLDKSFATLERGLAHVWNDTAVLAITEFGRTVNGNGTFGTDHGCATVSLLCGGAVKGGRVVCDWPGLQAAQLYEGRDLMPTTDLRAVVKGLLAEHLGLSTVVLDRDIFPETKNLRAMRGLVL